MTTVLPQLPPQTIADLSCLGAAFFVNGLVLVVPEKASAEDIFAAMDLLERVAQERYVAEHAPGK